MGGFQKGSTQPMPEKEHSPPSELDSRHLGSMGLGEPRLTPAGQEHTPPSSSSLQPPPLSTQNRGRAGVTARGGTFENEERVHA